MILKIGDVGSSVIKPSDDLIIIIDLNSQASIQKSIYLERIPSYIEFISDLYTRLPRIIANKTIISSILASKEFEMCTPQSGVDLDGPRTPDIINKYFDRFLFDGSAVDSDTMIVVNMP
jgi:hypothetical protein